MMTIGYQFQPSVAVTTPTIPGSRDVNLSSRYSNAPAGTSIKCGGLLPSLEHHMDIKDRR